MIDDLDVEMSPEHKKTLRLLNEMGDELKTKVVRRGLDVASQPVVDTMKALADKRTGTLEASIGRSKLSQAAAKRIGFETKPGEQIVLIGPNRKVNGRRRARIAQILEAGSEPHVIRGKLKVGENLFARKVKHPGIKARRFMEKSLERSQSGIEDRFFEGMKKRLDKITNKA